MSINKNQDLRSSERQQKSNKKAEQYTSNAYVKEKRKRWEWRA